MITRSSRNLGLLPILLAGVLVSGVRAADQLCVDENDSGARLSLENAVECLFRPPDLNKFRWYVRVRGIPASSQESEILLGFLDDRHVVRTASVRQGVWKLLQHRTVEKQALRNLQVFRRSRDVPVADANRWLKQVLDAAEETPSQMLSDSAIASSRREVSVFLDATVYVVDFHDPNLQFRMIVHGPTLFSGPDTRTPMGRLAASLRAEVEALLKE